MKWTIPVNWIKIKKGRRHKIKQLIEYLKLLIEHLKLFIKYLRNNQKIFKKYLLKTYIKMCLSNWRSITEHWDKLEIKKKS